MRTSPSAAIDHVKAAAEPPSHDRAIIDTAAKRCRTISRPARVRTFEACGPGSDLKFIRTILLLLILTQALPALGEDYPTRPITLVVPFSAGGPGDVIARLLGNSMSATLKQAVVIENGVGAGGNIGTNRVAKDKTDSDTPTLMHSQATAPRSMQAAVRPGRRFRASQPLIRCADDPRGTRTFRQRPENSSPTRVPRATNYLWQCRPWLRFHLAG
jgi:hypothetical protein